MDNLETLIGKTGYDELTLACSSLLVEANARIANPIDGKGTWVSREERLKLAAADVLIELGLLRRVYREAWCFIITDLGMAAVDRLEKSRA